LETRDIGLPVKYQVLLSLSLNTKITDFCSLIWTNVKCCSTTTVRPNWHWKWNSQEDLEIIWKHYSKRTLGGKETGFKAIGNAKSPVRKLVRESSWASWAILAFIAANDTAYGSEPQDFEILCTFPSFELLK
jgi:hypothetical protein